VCPLHPDPWISGDYLGRRRIGGLGRVFLVRGDDAANRGKYYLYDSSGETKPAGKVCLYTLSSSSIGFDH